MIAAVTELVESTSSPLSSLMPQAQQGPLTPINAAAACILPVDTGHLNLAFAMVYATKQDLKCSSQSLLATHVRLITFLC